MTRDDYPVSLKVKDVSAILNVGIHQAYDLVRSGQFPSRKVGTTIRVPREPFFDWFEGQNRNVTGHIPIRSATSEH